MFYVEAKCAGRDMSAPRLGNFIKELGLDGCWVYAVARVRRGIMFSNARVV